MKFDVRYYLVAILFIVFDLEIAFLFPWAVAARARSASLGLVAMGVFLARARGRLHLRVEEGGARMGLEREQPATRTASRSAASSTTQVDSARQLGAHRLAVADDLRARLLRGRDDARGRRAL